MITTILNKNAKQVKIEAQIEKITFHNPDNGWTVFSAKNTQYDKPFIVTGFFPDVQAGEYHQLIGKWHQHPTYGEQLQVVESKLSQPETKEAIIQYLSSSLFENIGEKTATAIVKYFGNQTLTILTHTPNKLNKVPKLSAKKIRTIQMTWEKQQKRSETLLFLFTHGLTSKTATRILNVYGEETKSLLSQNPYCLIQDIKGFGFLTADRIACSLGLPKDHPQRIKEAILYLLRKNTEQGHCYLNNKQLYNALQKLLDKKNISSEVKLKENLNSLNDNYQIVSYNPPLKTEPLHYLSDLYIAEKNVALNIHKLTTSFNTKDTDNYLYKKRIHIWLEKYLSQKKITLSEEQYSAVVKTALNKIFIITGGPGVGKTTVSNIIIKLYKAMGKSILICAPTGRAAKRIEEISTHPAKTIHRLLEWSPTEQRFLKNEDSPLATDLLIVDESSMIDTWLADKLLQAIALKTQLVFLGDIDQLPSIGPGNVLRDLIDSKIIPFIKLTKVYRQAHNSQIIDCAHLINSGTFPTFSKQKKSDCRFIEVYSNQDYLAVLNDLLTDSLIKAGYDAKRDIQVLTPMNLGPLGSKTLNVEMQSLLNKTKTEYTKMQNKFFSFKKEDKVIQLHNNYDLNVFNGDTGYITQTNVNNGELLVNFGDRLVSYNQEQLHELSLAYAISIHKSQGSEFPVAIILLSTQHTMMLQRNLIYTALTRAKKLAIFIGMPSALEKAITNNKSSQRQTLLIEHLKDKEHQ